MHATRQYCHEDASESGPYCIRELELILSQKGSFQLQQSPMSRNNRHKH